MASDMNVRLGVERGKDADEDFRTILNRCVAHTPCWRGMINGRDLSKRGIVSAGPVEGLTTFGLDGVVLSVERKFLP